VAKYTVLYREALCQEADINVVSAVTLGYCQRNGINAKF